MLTFEALTSVMFFIYLFIYLFLFHNNRKTRFTKTALVPPGKKHRKYILRLVLLKYHLIFLMIVFLLLKIDFGITASIVQVYFISLRILGIDQHLIKS